MSESHLIDLVPDVRMLTADNLGIGVTAAAEAGHGSTSPDTPSLASDDPTYLVVGRLSREYGGVIFTGPPGTGKSYMAAEIGRLLADEDVDRQWFVQFHASYQYEDFMYGFVPKKDGTGFEPRLGPFLQACEAAIETPDKRFVIVIDELSRADVGRVFGEALTYVERSKRERSFLIASGEEWRVPRNLVILATMNPQDRGVDEVDAAFERRFAKISMEPDRDVLAAILTGNGVEDALADRIIAWFNRVNSHTRKNPTAAVGHAYFVNVVDEATLQELWEHQLKFLVERAFRLDPNTGAEIETGWEKIFPQSAPVVAETIYGGGPTVPETSSETHPNSNGG